MKKILIWLSGWVDSAIATYLLKKQWYHITAGFMKNYIDEENPNCSTYQDAKEAIKVAEFLWIEIISFDLRQEYEEKIIKYIYDWYQKWITPNPDILCNNLIKFDVFLEKALKLGFDWIATGHYARIVPILDNGGIGYKLLRGVDYNKDQSYFLSWLNQYQLSKTLFPIGDMTKNEVRELAKKIWLPNFDRPDSQWLCFVWNVPMREFLKKRLAVKKGDIVLLDGTKVWEHDWAYFFTIWQSRGLNINKKAYVVKTDVEKNLVYVSYKKLEKELISKEIFISDRHWIRKKYNFPLECTTKIRYRQETQKATIFEINEKEKKLKVIYKNDQWWVAPWQTLTAYIDDECVGSGLIV
jgi:tRNA-specific 2-thiouridylase